MNDIRSHGLWERSAPPAPATAALTDNIGVDVAIIGAGYTGLSAGLHLSERRVSVAVLEAVEIGFGGSGRNVGLVNAGLWVMPDIVRARLGRVHGPRLVALLAEAPSRVFELIKRHDIACEASRRGTLHCGVGRRGFEELKERSAQWVACGAPVELLGKAEAASRTGSQAFSGALYDARAGTLQPLAYARGLAGAAITSGARVFTASPALSAESNQGKWIVRTARGSVGAEWIVVATDAYAEGPWRVARQEQVMLPYFNLATAPLDAEACKSILPGGEGAWDTRKVLSSFRLDASGRLVFGSVGALRGGSAGVHEEWARRAVGRIFPQLGRVSFETGWYGNIGMTADNLPRFHVYARKVIGFNGYNGRGIAPGTAFGAVLADFISGKVRESELPLPVTQPREADLRVLKESIYTLGSKALHWTKDRF